MEVINQADWRKIAKTVPHITPRHLDPDAPNDVTMLSGPCLVWKGERYYIAKYSAEPSGRIYWVGDFGCLCVDAEDLWIPLPRSANYCRGVTAHEER